MLSIVIPMYNTEKRLDECLRSVSGQRYQAIEVVLVDDGSTDGTLALARRHAAKDRRLTVLTQANAGPSAARSTGVAAATGTYLTFVDADDLVTLDGLVDAVASLEESGSDLALMPYERFRGNKTSTPRWIAELHAAPRRAVTIATEPDLLVHAIACSKLYRRSFWDEAGLEFPGVVYEDQSLTADAQVQARAVDVTSTLAYRWREEGGSRSQVLTGQTLTSFFDAVESALAILETVPGARHARALQVLGNDMPHYMRAIPRVQAPDYVETLFERLPALLDGVTAAELIPTAGVQFRVVYEIFRRGDRQRLFDFITAGGYDLNAHDGEVGPDGPMIHLPGWEAGDLPQQAFVVSERQSVLEPTVLRSRWTEDRLDVVVWGFLRHIDDATSEPQARAWLTTPGAEVEVPVKRRPKEKPGLRLGAWRESYDRSVWQIEIDVATLPVKTWKLELEVSFGGRTRRVEVRDVDPEGSAAFGPTPFAVGPSTKGLAGGVTAVEITADAITVEGGAPAELRSPVTSVARASNGSFPTTVDRWGEGPHALPVGLYELVGVRASESLRAELPIAFETETLRGFVVRTKGDGLGIRLVKPRADIAQTMYGHSALRREYRERAVEIDPTIAMFQSYWAETATDSPRAICEEMQRRRPDMQMFWGVLDHSVPVPDGTVAVVAGSPEWYDVLARAKYLVRNTELGAYTRLRPGQVHVQTFHGQPFKTMGTSLWRDVVQMPEFLVQYEATTRRSDFWSLILTPYDGANGFYRDNYLYDGPIHDQGLPRTDALVGERAVRAREKTRRLLGIGDDQVAVLHAATWREDKVGANNTSRDVQFVDLEKLARELGPKHVILQRSHGSVARGDRRHGDRPGVIDVTDHPEINDLIVASDAAIVDYSSLRFDYAITGRPMIFLVPDLERYENELRGFLFDFRESAPGPLVTDQDGVLRSLRDLESVRATYADEYTAFNERFNRWHDGRAAERVVDRMLEM